MGRSLALEGKCWTKNIDPIDVGALRKQVDAKTLAKQIRLKTLEMVFRARSSHIASAFSMAELLAVFYTKILKIDPEVPKWPERDRFILSKGHACVALYVTLAEKGFFPSAWLDEFYQDGGHLAGHVTHHVPGIEVSTGSLGHGLPIGCGMALSAKHVQESSFRVFVVLSDGECDEGSNWEAALFAHHHRLDNLTIVIDYNKIQSLGSVKEILDLEPLAEKWRTFGWSVTEIDGHDISQIERSLSALPREVGKPTCIIAHTVKGKGVSFMENNLLWHYRAPSDEELSQAVVELRRS